MDLSGPQGELPIPMQSHASYAHNHANVHAHAAALHNHGLLHDHHAAAAAATTNNGPPPPQHHHQRFPSPPLAPEDITPISTPRKRGGDSSVRYRECLKNHAAAIGGNATDGCGEFMPSGEDGSLEALKCSACGCHRNFHRKELEGEGAAALQSFHASSCSAMARRVMGQFGHKGMLVTSPSGGDPFVRALPAPPLSHHHHHMIMPLSAMPTSESDDMDGGMGGGPRPPLLKKRFRTKFTPDQKEKMLGFAEKVGWRLQKLEDGVVQQFCQEIGVKRRVLKVWMHNNKHNLAKKNSSSPNPMQLE